MNQTRYSCQSDGVSVVLRDSVSQFDNAQVFTLINAELCLPNSHSSIKFAGHLVTKSLSANICLVMSSGSYIQFTTEINWYCIVSSIIPHTVRVKMPLLDCWSGLHDSEVNNAAYIHVVCDLQHATCRSGTNSTKWKMFNKFIPKLFPLPANNCGKMTLQSTWWCDQANKCICTLEADWVQAHTVMCKWQSNEMFTAVLWCDRDWFWTK